MDSKTEKQFSGIEKLQLCTFIKTNSLELCGDIGLKLTYQTCKQLKNRDSKENVDRKWDDFFVKCQLRPEVVSSKENSQKTIFISSILAKTYELKLGDRVKISRLSPNDYLSFNGKLNLELEEEIIETNLSQPILLNDNTEIAFQNLKFNVKGGNFFGNCLPGLEDAINNLSDRTSNLIEYEVIQKIRGSVKKAQRIGKMTNVLLHGDSGSGKSTVLQQLQQICQSQEHIYCHWINCKQYIGK